jgi:hypothetical protein
LSVGEKKLDSYNQAIEEWSNTYEQGMNTLKSTSKGKFVEEEYAQLEAKLLQNLETIASMTEQMD